MKNDIFSFSRFGRYFAGDLAAICSGKGLGLISFGLLPVYVAILDLLFSSFGDGYEYMPVSSRIMIFAIAAWIFIIWTPAACYGYITDKRAGSVYTLIPVSSLEKALSMIISSVIVVPLAFLAVYFGLDLLITIVAGSPAEDSVMLNLLTASFTPVSVDFSDMALQAMNSILLFLLGAIIFRKHKIAKTILVWMGISTVLGFIALPIINAATDGDWLRLLELDTDDLVIWNTVSSFVMAAALCTAIFFRIKKIQY